MDFHAFSKIRRYNAPCIITEKIDGTNSMIGVELVQDGWEAKVIVTAGSRSQWITRENDNFGFAAWVSAYADKFAALPPGRYFGEWWGQGIQRAYGLHSKRWTPFNPKVADALPDLVHRLPLLYEGLFSEKILRESLQVLLMDGSLAALGFRPAEGVVVYFPQDHSSFKVTLDSVESWSPFRIRELHKCVTS